MVNKKALLFIRYIVHIFFKIVFQMKNSKKNHGGYVLK